MSKIVVFCCICFFFVRKIVVISLLSWFFDDNWSLASCFESGNAAADLIVSIECGQLMTKKLMINHLSSFYDRACTDTTCSGTACKRNICTMIVGLLSKRFSRCSIKWTTQWPISIEDGDCSIGHKKQWW